MQHSRPLSYYFRKLLSLTLLAVGLGNYVFAGTCLATDPSANSCPTLAGDQNDWVREFQEHQVPKGTGLSGHMHPPAINRKRAAPMRTAADLRPGTWVLDKTASRQPTWGIGGGGGRLGNSRGGGQGGGGSNYMDPKNALITQENRDTQGNSTEMPVKDFH